MGGEEEGDEGEGEDVDGVADGDGEHEEGDGNGESGEGGGDGFEREVAVAGFLCQEEEDDEGEGEEERGGEEVGRVERVALREEREEKWDAGGVLVDDEVGLREEVVGVGGEEGSVFFRGSALGFEEVVKEFDVGGVEGESREVVRGVAAADVLGRLQVAEGIAGLGEFREGGGAVTGKPSDGGEGGGHEEEVGEEKELAKTRGEGELWGIGHE